MVAQKSSKKAAPVAASPMALPSDARSWIVSVVAVAVGYACISQAASLGGVVIVPLVVGAIAALASSSWLQATVVCAIESCVLGVALPPGSGGGLGGVAVLVVIATVVAAALGWLRSGEVLPRRTSTTILSAGVLVLLVVNLWLPFFAGSEPGSRYGTLSMQILRTPPPASAYGDPAIYMRIYYGMQSGTGYYAAVRDAWSKAINAMHQVSDPREALPNGIVSYRLPTLFWLWRLLGPDGIVIELAFVFFASVATVAAWSIAEQLVGMRLAPLGAAPVAAYALTPAMSGFVTYVDLPATAIALAGVALVLRGWRAEQAAFTWAGVATLALAALTREMLVYLLALGLIASLFTSADRRIRAAAPWLSALGVFVIAYAAHVLAVGGQVSTNSSASSWLGGSPAFAADALHRFSDHLAAGGWVLPILFLLGVAGAWAGSRRYGIGFAIWLVPALVVPIVAMIWLGNPSLGNNGVEENYWGQMVVPLALALWPASLLLLPASSGSG